MFVGPTMSLRDYFIADDKEHRTSGNPEDDRDGWLGDPYGCGTDNSAYGFDEAGQTRNPEGAPLAIPDGEQRDRHRQSFRNVLHTDAYAERQTVGDVLAGESDTHRHPFRKVVQSNRNDKKPYPAEATARRSFAPELKMFMRRITVNREQHRRACKNTCNDHERSEAIVSRPSLGMFNCRLQQ